MTSNRLPTGDNWGTPRMADAAGDMFYFPPRSDTMYRLELSVPVNGNVYTLRRDIPVPTGTPHASVQELQREREVAEMVKPRMRLTMDAWLRFEHAGDVSDINEADFTVTRVLRDDPIRTAVPTP